MSAKKCVISLRLTQATCSCVCQGGDGRNDEEQLPGRHKAFFFMTGLCSLADYVQRKTAALFFMHLKSCFSSAVSVDQFWRLQYAEIFLISAAAAGRTNGEDWVSRNILLKGPFHLRFNISSHCILTVMAVPSSPSLCFLPVCLGVASLCKPATYLHR